MRQWGKSENTIKSSKLLKINKINTIILCNPSDHLCPAVHKITCRSTRPFFNLKHSIASSEVPWYNSAMCWCRKLKNASVQKQMLGGAYESLCLHDVNPHLWSTKEGFKCRVFTPTTLTIKHTSAHCAYQAKNTKVFVEQGVWKDTEREEGIYRWVTNRLFCLGTKRCYSTVNISTQSSV